MRAVLISNLKIFPLIIMTALVGCAAPDYSKDYAPLLQVYLEAWNEGKLDGLDRVCDPEFELRMTPGFEATIGLDSLKQDITYWRTAYPDFHITIDEVIYSKNAVAARWTITATKTGPGATPPTGKRVNVPGMSILHFQEGKIKDEWIAGNNLLWFEQLGYTLIPPAGTE